MNNYEHLGKVYLIALDLQNMFFYCLQLYASCLWTRRALQLCGAAKGQCRGQLKDSSVWHKPICVMQRVFKPLTNGH